MLIRLPYQLSLVIDPIALTLCSHTFSFLMLIQISFGYFLSDLAMILWNFPALGGMEYVSIQDHDK